ncbi:mitogen-activated protein kinase kinase kinase NPK1-like isoform X1 [Olea europaea var. sylvestris]|uniref:mitogen-activated protein kinase kinase kinase NPK1-like isoform X1 n=1 Tax=Olea europaea var. sylvestris TaxID=158386 RepID=UPI000C1D2091|nr:mitogen-activated protein kinase kinase kinase NPK1-like isoform X1 [Olea europaea var. sylvestris]
MQDFIGSVRRSLVFKPSAEETSGLGGFVEKIGSSIRKSRIGLFNKPPVHALPSIPKAETLPTRKYVKEEFPMLMMEDEALPPMEGAMEEEISLKRKKEEMVPLARMAKEKEAVGTSKCVKRKEASIRWRKGEMIGCGAFGIVYMGMNLDSGELLAVKEVAIGANSASKKAQDQLLELEKEVNLLKNLSHPNIVRYLGTAREEDSLHILLEFVPGGSISSLLGKFGSFPESVIRMYTKQLLLGLEYLHKYKIMHRDIKGANILVDNKGCIKLADFGASKKVEALATVTGAKSMKGTPYWMAPEVIVQSGHSYSADIWSVGCTVIEMATGKAPWSQQYQEVAAIFYIGTTKSHPPIPEHLSADAKDFLLKCLQKEPDLRPTASDLLKHPFVTGERQESRLVFRPSPVSQQGSSGKQMAELGFDLEKSMNVETKMTYNDLKDVNDGDVVRCSTVYPNQLSQSRSFWQPVNSDDDMCQIDDSDDLVFGTPANLLSRDYNQSFNPMCEPSNDLPCKFDESPELKRSGNDLLSSQNMEHENRSHVSGDMECGFTFPRGPASEDEDEATESRIREFLDKKALELKKLQTPLYEEFYNSLNVVGPLSPVGKENVSSKSNLPPKSRSPSRMVSRRLSAALDVENSPSPISCSRRVSNIGDINYRASPGKELDSQCEPLTPRASFFERERKWKEELVEELERKRELMRQAGVAKTSPKDQIVNRHKDRLRFALP